MSYSSYKIKIVSGGRQVAERELKKKEELISVVIPQLRGLFQQQFSFLTLEIQRHGTQNGFANNNCSLNYSRLFQGLKPSLTQIQTKHEQMAILKQQLLLLDDSDDGLMDYIETEKMFMKDVEAELGLMLFRIMKLYKQVQNNNQEDKEYGMEIKQNRENQGEIFHFPILTAENLEAQQEECLQLLQRISHLRKKMQDCIICYSEKANLILMPCMHLNTCSNCGKALKLCPICKESVSSSKMVYR